MNKKTLISIIFAGFMSIYPQLALGQSSTLPSGTSTDKCLSLNVIFDNSLVFEDGSVGGWKECENKKTENCKLRFCNSIQEAGNWKKDQCNKYCVTFQESIPFAGKNIKSISAESGTDLALNYASMIYKFGAIILSIVAVLVIVVSGIQMIAGGADENNYTSAKDRILQAILSLVLLFSSALILRTINPNFFS